jgi:hypothetical protein
MAATQQQLDDAEKAYNDLMLGRSPRVVVDQNGERVEFTPARKADLYAYIQQLRSELGLNSPAPSDPYALSRKYGPAGFVF